MLPSRMPAVACAALFMLLPACSRELAGETTPLSSREPSAAEPPGVPSRAPTSRSSTAANVMGSVSRATHAGSGVAVVELFTSEGCSSCPPADRALAVLTARAKAQSLPVYTLSFHVDYWNYLGWRDRFSSASYSERQHGYSGISANGGTYTPQAVVNGEAECIGSDSSRLNALIDAALKLAPRTQIELTVRRAAQAVEVGYRLSGSTSGRVLHLALVEPRAESQIQGGENAGERLAHVNVVRDFATRELSTGSSGHWTFSLGNELVGQRVSVVAFAQDTTQRNISGAAAVELP